MHSLKSHQMKAFACLCMLAAAVGWPASAQFLLHSGETFTYQFNSLPLYEAATELDSPPGGYWELQTAPISPTTPLQFRLEMFEDSVAEAPIGAMLYESSPSQPAWDAFTCISSGPFNWQDLQGVVRVTVLEGTLQLNSLWVTAWRPAGGGVDDLFFSGFVAIVPEPSTMHILVLSGTALAAWGFYQPARRFLVRGREKRLSE